MNYTKTEIPDFLNLKIEDWDISAEATFVNTKRRIKLKDKILSEWDFFDQSIRRFREVETDSLMLQVWASQVLSSEEFNIEELEKDCKKERINAATFLRENTEILIKILKDTLSILSVLDKQTKVRISLSDERFTPSTRWEQNNAREQFSKTLDYRKINEYETKIKTLIEDLKSIDNKLTDFINSGFGSIGYTKNQQETLKEISDFLDKLSVEAKIILTIHYHINDLQKIIVDFIEKVKEMNDFENGNTCKKLHLDLIKKQHAKLSKHFCLQKLPKIVYECDLYYTNTLKDKYKS